MTINGYTFKDLSIIKTALTHTSYANEHKVPSNQRLEFFGDSVLGMIVSEHIYATYMEKDEGRLSKMRASVVCEDTLNECAKRLELSSHILLGKGEEQHRKNLRPSIMSDAMEAIIAAIYLDGGYEQAKKFVLTILGEYISNASENYQFSDYKTILQEKVQAKGEAKIEYKVIKESGPDHDPTYEIAVIINGDITGYGTGHSKKKAEQNGAKNVLMNM